MSRLPYPGAGRLSTIAARTTVTRLALGVVLVVLVLAAAAAVRRPHLNKEPILPPASGGMLVLDLSASISPDTFSRIGATLRDIASRGGRYGLVVFSSTAYEAFPPGTPASELRSLARYFQAPPATTGGAAPSYPANPWTKSFTSGTEIAAGLELARRIELDAHTKHPAVVLISDLADDPQDLSRLTAELDDYKANGIKLTAIALNAAQPDLARFVGVATKIVSSPTLEEDPSAGKSPTARFPTTFVILIAATALLLALNELLAARVRWAESPA